MAGPLTPRLSFSAPAKSRLLVFDASGSDILAATALQGLEFAVLPSRGEVLYLNPGVLLRMIKHAGRIDWGLIRARRGRGLFGELYKVHLLACVDYIRPDVVVTWVDNSWLFHAVSRAYSGAEFYAMQNGNRSLGCVTTNPPRKVPGGYVTSMPNLLCFGRYEEELYRSHGHRIDRFHLVGPLIGGYYRSLHPTAPAPKYDICLPSQWRADLMADGGVIAETVAALAGYLGRYARERGVKVCVAARTSGAAERAFYEKALGPGATIVPHEDLLPSLSSYRAVDESAVVVGFCSTILLESVGWGKKVLFCNLFRDVDSYAPPAGPWSVDEPSYEVFRHKLDALRAMSPDEFRAAYGEFARRAVSFDPAKPAHLYLRELILKRLA
jgi:hypothetical protein